MNQWIERAVREAETEKARLLESVSDVLADVARIDAAIEALTGERPVPAVSPEKLGAWPAEPLDEPEPAAGPEPEPIPEPEPTSEEEEEPTETPREYRDGKAIARRSEVMEVIAEAADAISTKTVLDRVTEKWPEVVTLGNELRDLIREGAVAKVEDAFGNPVRDGDGFPLVEVGTGRPARREPPLDRVSRGRASVASRVPAELADMPAVKGRQTAKSTMIDAARDQKALWDAIQGIGKPFVINELMERPGVNIPQRRVGEYLRLFKGEGMLEETGVNRRDVEKYGPGKGADELRVVSTEPSKAPSEPTPEKGPEEKPEKAEGTVLPALKPTPELHAMPAVANARVVTTQTVAAAEAQLLALRALATEGPTTASEASVHLGNDKSDQAATAAVKSAFDALAGGGLAVRTGETRFTPWQLEARAASPRRAGGRPAIMFDITDVGRTALGSYADEVRPPARPTDGATAETAEEDTAAPLGLSLEVVRDCSVRMEGAFSPAQVATRLKTDHEIDARLDEVHDFLDTLTERGTLVDLSPTPDQPLYEYRKPTEPGRAAELDLSRRRDAAPQKQTGAAPVEGTGRPERAASGKVTNLLKAVERVGGKWRRTGSDHFLVQLADNRRTTIGGTPSESGFRQDTMKLRKLGVPV